MCLILSISAMLIFALLKNKIKRIADVLHTKHIIRYFTAAQLDYLGFFSNLLCKTIATIAAIALCILHNQSKSLYLVQLALLLPIPGTSNTFFGVMRKNTEIKIEFQIKVNFLFID